jgi:hypothetical protein
MTTPVSSGVKILQSSHINQTKPTNQTKLLVKDLTNTLFAVAGNNT